MRPLVRRSHRVFHPWRHASIHGQGRAGLDKEDCHVQLWFRWWGLEWHFVAGQKLDQCHAQDWSELEDESRCSLEPWVAIESQERSDHLSYPSEGAAVAPRMPLGPRAPLPTAECVYTIPVRPRDQGNSRDLLVHWPRLFRLHRRERTDWGIPEGLEWNVRKRGVRRVVSSDWEDTVDFGHLEPRENRGYS